MTSTSTSTNTRPSTITENRVVPIAAATVLGTAAFTALGVWGDGSGGDVDPGEFWFPLGLTVVAAAVVFGLAIPRVQAKAAGIGLGLSIGGLALVLAFWAGLTPVLAVGGIVLGLRARTRSAVASAAVAVGSLALVAYTAIYVLDWMSTNNIAGM